MKVAAVIVISVFLWMVVGTEGNEKAQCAITGADIEGPYYQPGAPDRTNDGIVCYVSPAHDVLSLSGQVFDGTDCKTPAGFTTLDIWHANPDGLYSEGRSKHSSDYGCRALITTDVNGKFSFRTLMPGRYDSDGFRPGHVHFKIYPPSGFVSITTQLYFNNDPYTYPNDSCTECNSKDKTLVVNLQHIADIKTYVGQWTVFLAKNASESNGHDHKEKPVDGQDTLQLKPKKGGYTKKESHIQPGAFRDAETVPVNNVSLTSYTLVAVACLAVGAVVGVAVMKMRRNRTIDNRVDYSNL